MAKGSDGCDTLKVCPDTRLTVGDSLRESQPDRCARRQLRRQQGMALFDKGRGLSLAERVTYFVPRGGGEIVLPTSTSARQFQPEAAPTPPSAGR